MHCPNSGELGEDLVAQWLQSQGWIILHRRFSSRWGEIDIIAQYDKKFEEVKDQGETSHWLNVPLTALSTHY